MWLADKIEQGWYRTPLINVWLWPLTALFFVLSHLRRIYLTKIKQPQAFSKPVVVVGNIAIGGTGKTPLTSFLIEKLAEQNIHAGVISRGYGGKLSSDQRYPLWVDEKVSAEQAGDEPKLISARHQCPVVVGSDRTRAAQYLIEQCHKLNKKLDIILCDDGLQHYKMHRDFEIVLLDASRTLKPNKVGLGNTWLMPAGPLREGAWRLETVDQVLINGDAASMQIKPLAWVNGKTLEQQPLDYFANRQVHAVAGIGNPQRFYNTLDDLAVQAQPHSFADHYAFKQQDIEFDDALPVVMTEKDWIKCREIVSENHWYLKISAELDSGVEQKLLKNLTKLVTSE